MWPSKIQEAAEFFALFPSVCVRWYYGKGKDGHMTLRGIVEENELDAAGNEFFFSLLVFNCAKNSH
jgi:hypothetical protein